jgi:hypothetical protein
MITAIRVGLLVAILGGRTNPDEQREIEGMLEMQKQQIAITEKRGRSCSTKKPCSPSRSPPIKAAGTTSTTSSTSSSDRWRPPSPRVTPES